MARTFDEWHYAAARVSPLIWEVQKAQDWTPARAKERLKELAELSRVKDYIGILTGDPEMESMRDRLVIVPINYSKTKYKDPFLVERCRLVEIYDWNGDLEFRGEMTPEQDADFLRWCAGYFVRLVGLQPPVHGP